MEDLKPYRPYLSLVGVPPLRWAAMGARAPHGGQPPHPSAGSLGFTRPSIIIKATQPSFSAAIRGNKRDYDGRHPD